MDENLSVPIRKIEYVSLPEKDGHNERVVEAIVDDKGDFFAPVFKGFVVLVRESLLPFTAQRLDPVQVAKGGCHDSG